MSKNKLFFTVLLIIVVASILIYVSGEKSNAYRPGTWIEADTAVNQAKHFFVLKKQSGENLSSGPCIADNIITGWVADIVHSPRQPIDDLPQNQCPAYLSGKAEHFVELDMNGKVVRVR